ncbi:hypothetical protein HDU98_001692 [Podochytrium sp. JEL0797]|nr:hypothetical protein HDU98_001692 [Podochytrium sp. JEL0797]
MSLVNNKSMANDVKNPLFLAIPKVVKNGDPKELQNTVENLSRYMSNVGGFRVRDLHNEDVTGEDPFDQTLKVELDSMDEYERITALQAPLKVEKAELKQRELFARSEEAFPTAKLLASGTATPISLFVEDGVTTKWERTLPIICRIQAITVEIEKLDDEFKHSEKRIEKENKAIKEYNAELKVKIAFAKKGMEALIIIMDPALQKEVEAKKIMTFDGLYKFLAADCRVKTLASKKEWKTRFTAALANPQSLTFTTAELRQLLADWSVVHQGELTTSVSYQELMQAIGEFLHARYLTSNVNDPERLFLQEYLKKLYMDDMNYFKADFDVMMEMVDELIKSKRVSANGTTTTVLPPVVRQLNSGGSTDGPGSPGYCEWCQRAHTKLGVPVECYWLPAARQCQYWLTGQSRQQHVAVCRNPTCSADPTKRADSKFNQNPRGGGNGGPSGGQYPRGGSGGGNYSRGRGNWNGDRGGRGRGASNYRGQQQYQPYGRQQMNPAPYAGGNSQQNHQTTDQRIAEQEQRAKQLEMETKSVANTIRQLRGDCKPKPFGSAGIDNDRDGRGGGPNGSSSSKIAPRTAARDLVISKVGGAGKTGNAAPTGTGVAGSHSSNTNVDSGAVPHAMKYAPANAMNIRDTEIDHLDEDTLDEYVLAEYEDRAVIGQRAIRRDLVELEFQKSCINQATNAKSEGLPICLVIEDAFKKGKTVSNGHGLGFGACNTEIWDPSHMEIASTVISFILV